MIRKIEEIQSIISHFAIHRLKWISDFHLRIIHNKYFEPISTLDVTFLLKENEITYEVCIRFSGVESLNFESRAILTYISGFNIKDVAKYGYHPMKYEIEDYEDAAIHFYCTDIEYLSIKESEDLAI